MADSNFSGAYVGGNIGYGAGKVKQDDRSNNTSGDLGVSGVIGGLHTGYQHQFGMFILGAEAAANLSNTEGTTKTDAVKTSFKRKNAFGLAARAGLAVNSWMTYVKLGWETAKFNAKESGNVAPNLADNYSKNKRLNAFVTGLGFETLVAKNMMIGAEWTYSFYQNKSFVSGADAEKFKPRIGDFKVRLGYKF
ncbi:MAG: porin family protein [Alphaproteobacteria bacterium]|nr:porin family protein [Alphaproteobacteria bacterium]